MFRICLRYGSTREEAEDMLQEGFLAIFRDLGHYRQESPLEGWMYRVMVNSALQYLRKQVNKPKFFEDPVNLKGISANENLEHRLDAEYLSDLIRKLPPGYRAVFNLFVVEGYKHEEISEKLNISVNTSRSQLHKARAWLKERIESILSAMI